MIFMEAQKTALLDFLQDEPEIAKVREQLVYHNEAVVYGVYEGQRTWITASLAQQLGQGNLLVLCDTQKRAKELWEDLVNLLPSWTRGNTCANIHHKANVFARF